MIWKLLKDENGYGTVEFMIIFMFAAVITGTVLAKLMPNISSLHEAMVNNITDISGTGY